jgi:hypothetical protein
MISLLIGILIIVVVGAICFWAIDKFALDARLATAQVACDTRLPRRDCATADGADLLIHAPDSQAWRFQSEGGVRANPQRRSQAAGCPKGTPYAPGSWAYSRGFLKQFSSSQMM